jgi:hypothetical protein
MENLTPEIKRRDRIISAVMRAKMTEAIGKVVKEANDFLNNEFPEPVERHMAKLIVLEAMEEGVRDVMREFRRRAEAPVRKSE